MKPRLDATHFIEQYSNGISSKDTITVELSELDFYLKSSVEKQLTTIAIFKIKYK